MCTTECNNFRSAEFAYCFIAFFVVSSVYYESWAFGMPIAIITRSNEAEVKTILR